MGGRMKKSSVLFAILPLVLVFSHIPLVEGASPSLKELSDQIRFKVEKYQLKNGLTVLLHEDHSAPVVSYHTWFRVGSRDEELGYTGIAHLFEHMMFRGAKRYSGEEFDRILQANGAMNNAFTSRDYTGYYEVFPSGKLELIIDLESDRMENLKIDDQVLQREREVVKEERRYRVDNSVFGALNELIFQTVFKVHSYSWPVIGWMKDLNQINVEKCLEFYKTYYSPNNAVIVVAGDFESEHAKKLIDKYYSGMVPQEIKRREVPPEPKQQGQRNGRIAKEVQGATISVNFPVPKSGEDEAYVADIIANVLGEGESSRLYRRLIYRFQLASMVTAQAATYREAGVFSIFASLKPSVSLEEAKNAIYGEIWNIREKGISDRELEKAKNQMVKQYVDSLKTIDGKARMMALNEIVMGSYDHFFKDIEKYGGVTKEQVVAVAKKYLQPPQRSLVVVEPKQAGQ